MNWELIGQIGLAVLLLVTIGYCAALERRLRNIRSAQEELGGLIAAFGQATLQAERGIDRLRETATEISGSLQGDINKAASLRDELRLITQTGNTLADKIERGLVGRERRPSSPPPVTARHPMTERDDDSDGPVSESERELMKALRQVS